MGVTTAHPVTATDALEATRGLHDGLAGLANALESGRLDGILEAEPALSLALANLTRVRSRLAAADFDGPGAAAMRVELARASALLARCAMLGGTLDDLVGARCGVTGYGASGEAIQTVVRGSLEAQV